MDNSFDKAYRAKHGHGPMEGLPPALPTPIKAPPPIPEDVRDPTQERESKLTDGAAVVRADSGNLGEWCKETADADAADPLSPWSSAPTLDTSKGISDNTSGENEATKRTTETEETMETGTDTPAATQPPKMQRASRRRGKLRILLTGPSGSGKTFTALMLAHGIGGNWCVVDTENESSTDYAAPDDAEVSKRGAWIFGLKVIRKPYTVEKYLKAFDEVFAEGYDGIIIDSISHEWTGEGGLLTQKEMLDRRGGNSFANFASITKLHERFKAMILQSPIHLIATGRSKQAHVIETGDNGKTTVRKVGLKMEQREGMEYEFTVALEMGMDHSAIASKDRTQMWPDSLTPFPIDESIGKQLMEWRMVGGDAAVDVVEAPTELQTDDGPAPRAEQPAQAATTQTTATAQPNGKPRIGDAMAACKKAGTTLSEEMNRRGWPSVTVERAEEIINTVGK